MAKTTRKYSEEYKLEAASLIRDRGMTIAQVGCDLGVCKSVIRDWSKKSNCG